MIQEDRLSRILSLISERQTISVSEIQETIFVSAATVRRDLAELARRGLIVRSFGGAVALTTPGRSVPKTDSSAPVSSPVALAAAELIHDRDMVFLDGSSAVSDMLPVLASKTELTVVTDSLSAANRLAGTVAHVHCCGGRYNSSLEIFTGAQTVALISRFRYDHAFISCDALSEDMQLTDYCLDRLGTLSAAMRLSKNRVFLCPQEITKNDAPHTLFPLSLFDIVISDAGQFFAGKYDGRVIIP